MEIVQAPLKMTTREDMALTIKQGLIAQAKLYQALKELEDLKSRYVDYVPKTVQDERDVTKVNLEEAQDKLEDRERQIEDLETSIQGARHIISRMFNVG